MFKILFFTLLLTAAPILMAIGQQNDSDRLKVISLNESGRSLKSNFTFTALLLESNEPQNFEAFSIKVGTDTITFSTAAHPPENKYQSNLIHFQESQNSFQLVNVVDNPQIKVVLIDGSGGNGKSATVKKKSNRQPCNRPEIIPQSEWRCGLNPPNYNRAFTEVKNIIVHHSAGSNTSTNYLQVVRSIYILHTQSNGWSDVGYNYLIDQEGTIYAGRDPGEGGAQDDVRGAHFCGSNSNSMGICLLGNYELVQATDTTYSSLNALLSWKINKEEQLTATGVTNHPLNSNLDHISGHRDGCATACPGQNVYDRLPVIRLEVEALVATCDPYDADADQGGNDSGEGCDDGGDDDDDGDDDGGDDDGGNDDGSDGDDDVIDLDVGEKIERDDFRIYPNPLNNENSFKVALSKLEQNAIDKVIVLNNLGAQVGIAKVEPHQNYIRIYLENKLVPGLYHVSFIKGETQVSRKFVVE